MYSHVSIAKFQVHKNVQKYENYWFGRSWLFTHSHIRGAQKCSKIRKLLVWKRVVLTHSHISIAKFQVHKNAQQHSENVMPNFGITSNLNHQFKHGLDPFTHKHCEISGAKKCSKIRKLLVWKSVVLTHSHKSIAKFQLHKNAQKYEIC